MTGLEIALLIIGVVVLLGSFIFSAKMDEADDVKNAELTEMGKMIREAISKLPPKDRTVVEYRFYRNMQVKDIAKQVGLSSSRVTRIVQASLNTVKEYLNARDLHGY